MKKYPLPIIIYAIFVAVIIWLTGYIIFKYGNTPISECPAWIVWFFN